MGCLGFARPCTFVAGIPKGTIDDRFVLAINRDIFAALLQAEDGKWPRPELRIWIQIIEVADGCWGAAGKVRPLKRTVDYVAPGMGDLAAQRFEAKKCADAAALCAQAQVHEAAD